MITVTEEMIKGVKPCFCGGTAAIGSSQSSNGNMRFKVCCMACFATTGWHVTLEAALDLWIKLTTKEKTMADYKVTNDMVEAAAKDWLIHGSLRGAIEAALKHSHNHNHGHNYVRWHNLAKGSVWNHVVLQYWHNDEWHDVPTV
jgi:hypothetical protein